MEQTAAKAVDQLLALGLPGVVILGAGFLVWWLLNKLFDSQEKRIEEGKATTAALASNTAALLRLTEVIERRT